MHSIFDKRDGFYWDEVFARLSLDKALLWESIMHFYTADSGLRLRGSSVGDREKGLCIAYRATTSLCLRRSFMAHFLSY